MIEIARWILAATHVLAGAAWFGAMVYSLMVLHPRARAFFRSPAEFEEFICWLAAGARWKVLGGCAVIALTGFGLLLLPTERPASAAWRSCIVGKSLLWTFAVGLFCFASWILWPARVLAAPADAPTFQRRFRWIAILLLAAVAANTILGVVSVHLK